MGTLQYIFHYAISSMIIGVVITIIGMVLFFLLIKGWYKNRTFNIFSLAVGVILFGLLCFQNILLCGAVHIKRMSNDFLSAMTQYVQPWIEAGNNFMESSEVDDLLFDDLAADYPIIYCYLGGSEFSGYRASEIPQAAVDALNEYFNWYIFRRACWEILFVVVGAIIVIKTMEKTFYSRKPTAKTGRATPYIHDSSRNIRVGSRTTRFTRRH